MYVSMYVCVNLNTCYMHFSMIVYVHVRAYIHICKYVCKHMENPSDITKTRIAYVHILHTYIHNIT